MNKKFGDTSIAIHFIQQLMSENYNDAVKVSGEYYTHFEMNYGFAHFIAKYLDYKYPLLDSASIQAYKDHANETTDSIRSINEPISLMNYFLCDNRCNRLVYIPQSFGDQDNPKNDIYREIYNQYMILYNIDNEIKPYPKYKNYFNDYDMPLFSTYDYDYDAEQYQYGVNNNIIFTLDSWSIDKGICEIDDFVGSYLLGRTITPQSSRDDIYYVQKLLIRDRNIMKDEMGVWCMNGAKGTEYDLTQTIIQYQQNHVDALNSTPLFVTGYFDIFTEACIRKELGVDNNGIRGL